MTSLSVNINKIATLRNSRGGDMPNLIQTAQDIEALVRKELRYILVLMSDTFAIETHTILKRW